MTRNVVDSIMRFIAVMTLGAGLLGCSSPQQVKPNSTEKRINEELKQAAQPTQPEQPDSVKAALLPPLKIEIPKGSAKAIEPRFDLVVNNAPAAQVLMGIVSGTRYSISIPPEMGGTITANLKDVTVFDALDDIRETYGYEYKVVGTRIYIQSQDLQTKVFKVNYLVGSRTGMTNIVVRAGSSGTTTGTTGTTGTAGSSPTASGTPGATGTTGSGGGGTATTNISTSSKSDFWKEITTSLEAIVGNKEGRSVVVSPQSGVIVVRATPLELRNVAEFLNASQLSVERQVILEAKIIEVELSDDYQTGINWAAFRSNPNSRLSIGIPGNNEIGPTGALVAANSLLSGTPGSSLKGTGGMFGLVFQTSSFATMLSFLENQGNVHVLSSPRIATLNNQKAVLKVGNEDYYVTSASSTTTTGTATTTTPSVNLQQFFSGIVLDVTPQIDDKNNIILHIHPSVTRVSETNKVINMGGATGTLTLPVASTVVSETDSIVRAQDGHIVAIGGLMKQSNSGDFSQPPGLKDVPVIGDVLRQTKRTSKKTELVILLKPTVVQDSSDWSQDVLNVQQRIQAMSRE